MRVESHSPQGDAGERHGIAGHAHQDKTYTRDEKQPARTVHKKKPDRPPAVPKRPEMRGVTLPPVGMQSDRYFSRLRTEQARLDDHFGCEFHPRAALIEVVVG